MNGVIVFQLRCPAEQIHDRNPAVSVPTIALCGASDGCIAIRFSILRLCPSNLFLFVGDIKLMNHAITSNIAWVFVPVVIDGDFNC